MIQFRIHRSPDASHTVGTDPSGNQVQMYLPEVAGGSATGVRPMQMLILGLGGCTAVDVLMVLKKKRLQVDDFWIDVHAEREEGKEPALWQTVVLEFHVVGPVPLDKAEHAVQLSMEKYCSVSETLRRAGADIQWKVTVSLS
jgi:putative redox protein